MRIFPAIFLIFFILTSCKNKSQEIVEDPAVLNEELTKMNARMVSDESKEIDDFVLRHSIKPVTTGTGLRYEIYVRGSGKRPSIHDHVQINYKIFLLDGKPCYSSDSLGSLKFIIGAGEQPRGLEEALMQMVPGDKARLVIPTHLAYGVSGDKLKIPPMSALYYEVELLSVNK